jgi:hypothetical protein
MKNSNKTRIYACDYCINSETPKALHISIRVDWLAHHAETWLPKSQIYQGIDEIMGEYIDVPNWLYRKIS